jgi:hypothetical protein
MAPLWVAKKPVCVVAVLVTILSFAAGPAHAQGPFTGLAGGWSGSGSVTLKSGTRESLRCRAKYDVENAGNSVKMNLRCASDSYRFDLKGTVVHERGALGGTWSEETRQVSGSVSGSASPDSVQARISGPNFVATIQIDMRGKRSQAVNINSDGQALSRVALTLTRAGG